jgi:hypothetical protein
MSEEYDIDGDFFEIEVEELEFVEEVDPYPPVIDQMLYTNSSNLMAVLYFEEDFFEDLKKFNELFKKFGVDVFLKPEFLIVALDVYVYNRLNGRKLLSVEELKVFKVLFEFSEKFIKGLSLGEIDFLSFSYTEMKKMKDLCLKLIYIRQASRLKHVFSKNNRFARALQFIDCHLDSVIDSIYSSLSS